MKNTVAWISITRSDSVDSLNLRNIAVWCIVWWGSRCPAEWLDFCKVESWIFEWEDTIRFPLKSEQWNIMCWAVSSTSSPFLRSGRRLVHPAKWSVNIPTTVRRFVLFSPRFPSLPSLEEPLSILLDRTLLYGNRLVVGNSSHWYSLSPDTTPIGFLLLGVCLLSKVTLSKCYVITVHRWFIYWDWKRYND